MVFVGAVVVAQMPEMHQVVVFDMMSVDAEEAAEIWEASVRMVSCTSRFEVGQAVLDLRVLRNHEDDTGTKGLLDRSMEVDKNQEAPSNLGHALHPLGKQDG